jgi:hypothetical protein
MYEWRRQHHDGSGHPIFANWTEGIHHDFRDDAVRAVAEDEVRLHEHAAALTSSQAFAFNLFMPWRRGPRATLEAQLAKVLGESIVVDRINFEWVPPGALLGEIDGDRPKQDEPATGVDVVSWGRGGDGARVVLLLEVKLGEGGFTACGGRESRANRRPDVCASAELFFSDPSCCYLQHPRGKSRDRRYWEIFARSFGSVRASFPQATTDGPCPFAGQQQQPMRNFALAHALVQEGLVDRAWFGLCAHDENPDVAAHWAAWQALLPSANMAPVLHASNVIEAGRDAGLIEWSSWMSERYQISDPDPGD